MRYFLLAALVLSLAAACGERPPRPDPEAGESLNLQKGPNPTVERTLNQGESERMGI
ncbi:MAG TPA: hypothetical protein VF211_10280 [Burkholderiales bacterium]